MSEWTPRQKRIAKREEGRLIADQLKNLSWKEDLSRSQRDVLAMADVHFCMMAFNDDRGKQGFDDHLGMFREFYRDISTNKFQIDGYLLAQISPVFMSALEYALELKRIWEEEKGIEDQSEC